MKKILFFLLCMVPALIQGQTMREAFIAMPDSLQPLLTHNNRMDMLDFLDFHMTARVTNRMEEQSTMDTLTADYLKITLTSNATIEMKLLSRQPSSPVKEEKEERTSDNGENAALVVAVVHTVAGPVKDSVLKLYSYDWKSELPLPELPSFSAYEAKPRTDLTDEERSIIKSLEDMQLVEMTLSPADQTLRCRLSLDILPKEEREKARQLVKPVEMGL